MIIDEDTGDAIECQICYEEQYWNCGHLVACFDRTFCRCRGGAACDRLNVFTAEIEKKFLHHVRAGTKPNMSTDSFEDLWNEAKNTYRNGVVFLDQDILQRCFIELLEESGAYRAYGSIIDTGGPGETSSMALLFAVSPSEVVNKAFSILQI